MRPALPSTLFLALAALGACGDGREKTVTAACTIFERGPSQVHDRAAPFELALSLRLDLTLQTVGDRLAASGTFRAPMNSEYLFALTPETVLEIGNAIEGLGPICAGRAVGFAVSLSALEHALSIGHAAGKTSVVVVENERRRRIAGGGGDFDFD